VETPKTADISVVSPKENIPHKYATGTQNIVSNRPNLLIDKHSGKQSNDRYKLQRKTDYEFCNGNYGIVTLTYIQCTRYL